MKDYIEKMLSEMKTEKDSSGKWVTTHPLWPAECKIVLHNKKGSLPFYKVMWGTETVGEVSDLVECIDVIWLKMRDRIMYLKKGEGCSYDAWMAEQGGHQYAEWNCQACGEEICWACAVTNGGTIICPHCGVNSGEYKR